MADVPLVAFAVNFWRTQHPGNRVVAHLPRGMLLPFLVAMCSFTLLAFVLLAARVAIGRGERRLAAVADRAVEAGRLE